MIVENVRLPPKRAALLLPQILSAQQHKRHDACKAAERPRLLVPLQSVLGLKALCDSVGTWVEIGICRGCGRFWGVPALVRCNIMRLSFAHSACDGAAR